MAYFTENIKNTIDFFLRRNISYSRKNYTEKPENINKYRKEKQYIELSKKYNLGLFENSSKNNFLLNLYFLSVFDKYLIKKDCKNISILDIGSKNWEYVKSEYLFFKSFCKNITLNGIELDSNRLNSKLYNRYEVSKFHTKNLENTNYISGDLLEHEVKYDYIIWILPFMSEYPLIKWGLPLKYFKPEKMLLHAYNLLKDGGQLLVINQGENEYNIQKALNNKLKLNCSYFNAVSDEFNIFKNKRFCSVISK